MYIDKKDLGAYLLFSANPKWYMWSLSSRGFQCPLGDLPVSDTIRTRVLCLFKWLAPSSLSTLIWTMWLFPYPPTGFLLPECPPPHISASHFTQILLSSSFKQPSPMPNLSNTVHMCRFPNGWRSVGGSEKMRFWTESGRIGEFEQVSQKMENIPGRTTPKKTTP